MTTPRPTAHWVDDAPHAPKDKFGCLTAADADAALRMLHDCWGQVVICNQRVPGRTGVHCLTAAGERGPNAVQGFIPDTTTPAAMAQAINAAGIRQFLTQHGHPDPLCVASRNGSRRFQRARATARFALDTRCLACTAQPRLDRRRAALREGVGVESPLRRPTRPAPPRPVWPAPSTMAGCRAVWARLACHKRQALAPLLSKGTEHAHNSGAKVLTNDLHQIAGSGMGLAACGAELALPPLRAGRGEAALQVLRFQTEHAALPGDARTDRSAELVLAANGTLKDGADRGLSHVGLRVKLDRYGIAAPSDRLLAEEDA